MIIFVKVQRVLIIIDFVFLQVFLKQQIIVDKSTTIQKNTAIKNKVTKKKRQGYTPPKGGLSLRPSCKNKKKIPGTVQGQIRDNIVLRHNCPFLRTTRTTLKDCLYQIRYCTRLGITHCQIRTLLVVSSTTCVRARHTRLGSRSSAFGKGLLSMRSDSVKLSSKSY